MSHFIYLSLSFLCYKLGLMTACYQSHRESWAALVQSFQVISDVRHNTSDLNTMYCHNKQPLACLFPTTFLKIDKHQYIFPGLLSVLSSFPEHALLYVTAEVSSKRPWEGSVSASSNALSAILFQRGYWCSRLLGTHSTLRWRLLVPWPHRILKAAVRHKCH